MTTSKVGGSGVSLDEARIFCFVIDGQMMWDYCYPKSKTYGYLGYNHYTSVNFISSDVIAQLLNDNPYNFIQPLLAWRKLDFYKLELIDTTASGYNDPGLHHRFAIDGNKDTNFHSGYYNDPGPSYWQANFDR